MCIYNKHTYLFVYLSIYVCINIDMSMVKQGSLVTLKPANRVKSFQLLAKNEKKNKMNVCHKNVCHSFSL